MRSFDKKAIPCPPNFKEISYNRKNPFDIEVGCGVGYHPIQYARANPDRTLLALERTVEKYQKFERRLQNHPEIKNIIPIHGDAIPWIVHGVKESSVDRYLFLYPNPYPKEKHRNQRWYAMPFMEVVLETLKSGGTITLATNMEYYFAEAKEAFMEVWRLKIISERSIAAVEKPRTHFEKKYLARGEKCFELIVAK